MFCTAEIRGVETEIVAVAITGTVDVTWFVSSIGLSILF